MKENKNDSAAPKPATKRIKMKADTFVVDRNVKAGEVLDVPPIEADHLVKIRLAEYVAAE